MHTISKNKQKGVRKTPINKTCTRNTNIFRINKKLTHDINYNARRSKTSKTPITTQEDQKLATRSAKSIAHQKNTTESNQ